MALANSTLITVTATYTRLDGRAASGQVFFSSNQVLVNSTSGEIVPPVDFVATLDANGAISIDLPATDDPDYEPQGWTYTVTEDTDGGDRPPFGLSVPADGGAIDLADVAPPGPTESLTADEYTLLSTFTSHRSAWGGDPPAGSADDLIGLDANNVPKVIPESTYEKALNLVHDVTHPNYGATGDGTTDDLAAIKSAVDTVENDGGGIVFFPMPSSYYRITDTLVVDEPVGVMLVGASREGCDIVPEGTAFAGAPVIRFRNAYHSGLEWLTVRGNSTNVPSAIVEVRSVTATKGHGATGFKAQHCMFGSTTSGSATYGVQWTFDTGEDANNDFGYVEDCQIANLNTAYRVEGVNSLEHVIVGGKVGANVASLVSFNGGSARFFGTAFVPGLSGWLCDIEGNSYKHPIVFTGVTKESGDGVLRAASTVDSTDGVNVQFIGGDVGDAPLDALVVDFQAPNSHVEWIGTEAVTGQSGTKHHYTQASTRANYVACRLGVSEIQWEGVLNLADNHHNVGSLTLTKGTSATLSHIGESGGGPGGVFDDDSVVDISVGAGGLEAHFGTPAIVRVGTRWAAWAFDDAADEQVGGVVDIPAHWSTFDVDLWHTTTTGNAGNAQIEVRTNDPAAGESLSREDNYNGGVQVAAVGTANTLGVATILTGASTTAGPHLIMLHRAGGNAGDDLTGDFMALALVLRRTG